MCNSGVAWEWESDAGSLCDRHPIMFTSFIELPTLILLFLHYSLSIALLRDCCSTLTRGCLFVCLFFMDCHQGKYTFHNHKAHEGRCCHVWSLKIKVNPLGLQRDANKGRKSLDLSDFPPAGSSLVFWCCFFSLCCFYSTLVSPLGHQHLLKWKMDAVNPAYRR